MYSRSSLALLVTLVATLLTPRLAAANECAKVPIGPARGKVSIYISKGVVRTYRICKTYQQFALQTTVWVDAAKTAQLKPPPEGQCTCVDVSGANVAVETSTGNGAYPGMVDIFYTAVP